MVRGIPYWGTATFADLRSIPTLPVLSYTANDWYSLFSMLIDDEYCVIIQDKGRVFLSWCSDVVFDYRDKAIFVPYYSYDKKAISDTQKHKHLDTSEDVIHLHYNFRLKLKPLLIRACRYVSDDILVYQPATKKVLRIVLTELPYVIPGSVPSADELYSRYVEATYYDELWSEVEYRNKYHWISDKGINIESELRRKYGLPTNELGRNTVCTEQVARLLDCRDIRSYDLSTMQSVFGYKGTNKLYPVRWFEFSAYLLLNMLSGAVWQETAFNKGLRRLQTGDEVFEYGNRELPLYIKHYYLPTDNRKPKTYERYLPGLTCANFE